MNERIYSILLFLFVLHLLPNAQEIKRDGELVYLDENGVIKWKSNHEEVALFGANYNLPSACDYRAAGYVNANRKELIEQDMAHFARMGWNGLRLCLWGDWENSDREGNLLENDHLDLLDYLIAKAKERGIYMLFTPITTYSALWPDALGDTASVEGFSKYFSRSELGVNPDAIHAQLNYLDQILEHVNPYTGIALKNEPNILFIEMINEPFHHPEDFEGSVNYINSLVKAVRNTGCKKILFHNLTQDMKIAPAIKASDVDGVSFAMYPAGLVFGSTLNANLLRTVDEYPPMLNDDLAGMPRIVYEFDEADSYTPYMYPAMTRTFRSVGAQFVAMFSYDMLATAPYNLGWQTHAMNMIYYPQKAVGAIIAKEVMNHIPRMKNYGSYPENTEFGPFRISYSENISEMVGRDKFIYANNTASIPARVNDLNQIIGFGSSPIVQYEGFGIYFLDKIDNEIWRLEVYPDAIVISDPFAQISPDKQVSRLIYREWSMTINIPDLSDNFNVVPINDNNTFTPNVIDGRFNIRPGVYIITKNNPFDTSKLPAKLGNVKMEEFISPETLRTTTDILHHPKSEFLRSQPVIISADVIANDPIEEVNLFLRNKTSGRKFYKIPMDKISGYTYSASIPEEIIAIGIYEYCIAITRNKHITTYPSKFSNSPDEWGFHEDELWQLKIVNDNTPLPLLIPDEDIARLAFTRIGDGIRHGIYEVDFSETNGQTTFRIFYPESYDKDIGDYTMSLIIKDRIESRGMGISSAQSIKLQAKSENEGQEIFITLMEADGTSWFKKISLSSVWKTMNIPLDEFSIGKGVKLPLGYPERWNYWVESASNRGTDDDHIQTERIERLQVSIRSSVSKHNNADTWIEIGQVNMMFE